MARTFCLLLNGISLATRIYLYNSIYIFFVNNIVWGDAYGNDVNFRGGVVIGRHWGNTGPITQDSVDR